METSDKEMLKDFQTESKQIVTEAAEVLDVVENDIGMIARLEYYGQLVDRIMGGAKTLSVVLGGQEPLDRIGEFASLCKAVGYKSSQLESSDQFAGVCIALLQDATTMLDQIIHSLLDSSEIKPDCVAENTLLDRLKWASDKFGKEFSASVRAKSGPPSDDNEKMSQSEIDELLRKLRV